MFWRLSAHMKIGSRGKASSPFSAPSRIAAARTVIEDVLCDDHCIRDATPARSLAPPRRSATSRIFKRECRAGLVSGDSESLSAPPTYSMSFHVGD